MRQPPLGYKAPQPVEVYVLSDHANASIPQDIREQFQRDDQGRVLFFTAPPVVPPEEEKEGIALGHSARYLAAKAKRAALLAEKRKGDAAGAAQREQQAKRVKLEAERKYQETLANLTDKAINALADQLARATKKELGDLFGEDEKEREKGLQKQLEGLEIVQREIAKRNEEQEKKSQMELAKRTVPITGMTVRLEEKF